MNRNTLDRRTFLRASVAALGAGAPLLSQRAAAAVAGNSRPNILFIMADDHTQAAMSCYGSKTIKTPNLDRLAAQGMMFSHATVTVALCAPSRAVLLTGKYSHLNGYRKNGDRFDGSQQVFPRLMQQQGYETAIVGKWHLQTEPPGFDHYCVMPAQGRYYDCPLKTKGEPWEDGRKGGKIHKGYLTDVITDQAISWLSDRSEDKPFCLMVHHKAPHGPHDPAPRHADLFEDTTFPEPSSLMDDYEGRAPEHIEDEIGSSRMAICHYPEYKEDIEKYKGDREKATRYMYQTYMKGYLRLVTALDENIGRLLDYLDASGLSENTLVIYTSDNGFFNGEHGFFNKMWMYEESLHLPFLVRCPGMIQPGSKNDKLVSMLDLAPTFLDIAGAPIPEDMQGASLKPLLLGQDPPWRDVIYYHYYEQYDIPQMYGVRTKTHKLIHYPTLEPGPKWELFDLVKDPGELHNLATLPEYESTLKELQAILKQKREEFKDVS